METEPPMHVTDTTARMVGKVSCDPGETGTMWWRYAKEGSTNWTTTNPVAWTCPQPNKITGLPLGRDISGLQPSTRYRYQFCAKRTDIEWPAVCHNARAARLHHDPTHSSVPDGSADGRQPGRDHTR